MRDNPYHEIEMLAQGLPEGQSMRVVCPTCLGGSERERCMSITRAGGQLKWNCFRSSCPAHGIGHSAAYAVTDAPTAAPHEPYRGAFNRLEQADIDYFARRFSLLEYLQDAIGYNDEGQYVFRVYGPLGLVRGFNVRRLPWAGEPQAPRTSSATSRPKTKLWLNTADDLNQSIHWPLFNKPDALYIVEDQVSALKIAQEGQCGAALLGDGMTIEKVRELQRLPMVSETYIALDKDASKRAFDLARQFGLAFQNMKVLLLDKDIKDLSRAEVRTIMRQL